MEQTASNVLPKLGINYKLAIEKDYGKVFLLPDEKILILELTKEYVPIEEFREIFTETIPLVKEHKIEKFIFDKQNLRVFHQPSMEWYFVEWKKELYELGLIKHRKILPKDQPAFKMAVEAGRAKILAEYPNLIIDKLDIQYKDSIEEAIKE